METKRRRDDETTKIMGQYLLKGYTLLDDYCDKCQLPLMRLKRGATFCVACPPLDVRDPEESTEKPTQSTQGLEVASTKTPLESGRAPGAGPSRTKSILENKIKWAEERLDASQSVDECLQLCTLIKSCVDTVKSLDSL